MVDTIFFKNQAGGGSGYDCVTEEKFIWNINMQNCRLLGFNSVKSKKHEGLQTGYKWVCGVLASSHSSRGDKLENTISDEGVVGEEKVNLPTSYWLNAPNPVISSGQGSEPEGLGTPHDA